MPLQRPSVEAVSLSLPSRFEFVERQLERTLERIVRQSVVRRAQQHTPADYATSGRLRLVRIDGAAAT
jgi:hypothetical protein